MTSVFDVFDIDPKLTPLLVISLSQPPLSLTNTELSKPSYLFCCV